MSIQFIWAEYSFACLGMARYDKKDCWLNQESNYVQIWKFSNFKISVYSRSWETELSKELFRETKDNFKKYYKQLLARINFLFIALENTVGLAPIVFDIFTIWKIFSKKIFQGGREGNQITHD